MKSQIIAGNLSVFYRDLKKKNVKKCCRSRIEKPLQDRVVRLPLRGDRRAVVAEGEAAVVLRPDLGAEREGRPRGTRGRVQASLPVVDHNRKLVGALSVVGEKFSKFWQNLQNFRAYSVPNSQKF